MPTYPAASRMVRMRLDPPILPFGLLMYLSFLSVHAPSQGLRARISSPPSVRYRLGYLAVYHSANRRYRASFIKGKVPVPLVRHGDQEVYQAASSALIVPKSLGIAWAYTLEVISTD